MKTTSIRLTDEEEATLTELAAKMKCRSRYGATSGQPSWRVMLQHLAEGRLTISNPLDKTRKVFINFKKPPGWWKPDENESMLAADVAAKYKTTVEILEEKGFVLDGDRIYAGNWKGWRTAKADEKQESKVKESPASCGEDEMPDVPPLMLATPDWFVRLPKMMAMPLTQAIESSGMDRDEMELHGLVIKKINGQQFVSGPPGSEWADSDDSAAPAGDVGEILSMMVEDESQPEKVKSGRIKKS